MKNGIFITATDTNVGKTYVSAHLADALSKLNKKIGYFKPFQSGVEEGILSDVETVQKIAPNVVGKNSYITKTPATPAISAEIDGVEISLKKVVDDYNELSKNCDFTIVEGSGGLMVPIRSQKNSSHPSGLIFQDRHKVCENPDGSGELLAGFETVPEKEQKNSSHPSGLIFQDRPKVCSHLLMSDVVLALNLPVIIVARPDLGTINHTLLTISVLKNMGAKILGVIISNYPKNTTDPAILTAKKYIEEFSNIRVLATLYDEMPAEFDLEFLELMLN